MSIANINIYVIDQYGIIKFVNQYIGWALTFISVYQSYQMGIIFHPILHK